MVAHLRALVDVPILTGFPFGHVPTKVTVPFGVKGHLVVQGRDVFLGWDEDHAHHRIATATRPATTTASRPRSSRSLRRLQACLGRFAPAGRIGPEPCLLQCSKG